ncbi:EamA family transporter, partial [Zavarzinia sp.]|uniref:EamA family transporter n=1 Tax=Zavarzinia sp. TaxID=2027920 RepID=UPI0035616039
MVTVVLGLGSALGYALHDFLMVKIVRAAAVWTALTWSMAVGVAILVPLALVLDGPPSGAAEWRAAGFAAASGVCEAAGLGCLLRGLVVGNLSVVTPLASLAGGFVAVIMIVQGEPLPALAAIGLSLAVAGGLMASVEMAPKEELFGPDGAAAPARRTRATAGAGWALLSSALFSVT